MCPVRLFNHFNPRSPHGERPLWPEKSDKTVGISIHALLTESDGGLQAITSGFLLISIHALLTESDMLVYFSICIKRNFNPRSPHGERPHDVSIYDVYAQFQSTLSSRRATRDQELNRKNRFGISIHALLTESDSTPRQILASC